jgi:hypothetical protein
MAVHRLGGGGGAGPTPPPLAGVRVVADAADARVAGLPRAGSPVVEVEDASRNLAGLADVDPSHPAPAAPTAITADPAPPRPAPLVRSQFFHADARTGGPGGSLDAARRGGLALARSRTTSAIGHHSAAGTGATEAAGARLPPRPASTPLDIYEGGGAAAVDAVDVDTHFRTPGGGHVLVLGQRVPPAAMPLPGSEAAGAGAAPAGFDASAGIHAGVRGRAMGPEDDLDELPEAEDHGSSGTGTSSRVAAIGTAAVRSHPGAVGGSLRAMASRFAYAGSGGAGGASFGSGRGPPRLALEAKRPPLPQTTPAPPPPVPVVGRMAGGVRAAEIAPVPRPAAPPAHRAPPAALQHDAGVIAAAPSVSGLGQFRRRDDGIAGAVPSHHPPPPAAASSSGKRPRTAGTADAGCSSSSTAAPAHGDRTGGSSVDGGRAAAAATAETRSPDENAWVAVGGGSAGSGFGGTSGGGVPFRAAAAPLGRLAGGAGSVASALGIGLAGAAHFSP